MIDHLVFAGTELDAASRRVTALLGVVPTPGGSHVGAGTRNELLALGGSTYLEVIGPDPDQPEPPLPRPFGVDRRVEPGLVAWCVRPSRPLGEIVAAARAQGIDFGDAQPMSRLRPDGVLLQWELTPPQTDGPLGGALPFLIDWGGSAHPTDTLTPAVRLVELQIETPQPDTIIAALTLLGVTTMCAVRASDRVLLTARVATAGGEVSLSG